MIQYDKGAYFILLCKGCSKYKDLILSLTFLMKETITCIENGRYIHRNLMKFTMSTLHINIETNVSPRNRAHLLGDRV